MPYAHLFSVLSSHLESLIIQGGYPLLFLLVILEGIPLVGTVIPGHVAIIAAGFLSRIGVLNIYWALAISLVGALIGDFIGFSLGRKYGLSLIDRLRRHFFIKDSHIDKARKMLDTHTGKAMFFGRFSPVTRALLPFLVGTGEISAGKFWLYNVLGGASWVILSMLLGYAFGAGYHAVSGYFGKFALIAVIVAILIVWGYRFVNMRFHIFAKYELFILGLNVASLIALSRTIQDAWAGHSFLASFDVTVNIFMDKANHLYPLLANIALWVTNIGGTAVTTSLGVLLGTILLFRHKWRFAFIALFSMGLTGAAVGILKEFFLRARPDNALILMVNDPSFPSGHAAMAAAFFVVVAYIFAPKICGWVRREVVIVACALVVILIGLSRVVLNVHWASDVIAGWSLGIFMATGSILLVRYVGELVTKKTGQ